MGGARKWPENGATAGELVASFPGYVGGARKLPENEATAVKSVNLWPCSQAMWEELGSGLRTRLQQ